MFSKLTIRAWAWCKLYHKSVQSSQNLVDVYVELSVGLPNLPLARGESSQTLSPGPGSMWQQRVGLRLWLADPRGQWGGSSAARHVVALCCCRFWRFKGQSTWQYSQVRELRLWRWVTIRCLMSLIWHRSIVMSETIIMYNLALVSRR